MFMNPAVKCHLCGCCAQPGIVMAQVKVEDDNENGRRKLLALCCFLATMGIVFTMSPSMQCEAMEKVQMRKY